MTLEGGDEQTMAEEKYDPAKLMAAIAILIALGGVVVGNIPVDSPESYENTYVCDVNQAYGVFYGGVSGTLYSAYPNAEDRKGAVRCGSSDLRGSWTPLLEYVASNGLDVGEFLLSDPVASGDVPVSAAGDYLCAPLPKGCEVI